MMMAMRPWLHDEVKNTGGSGVCQARDWAGEPALKAEVRLRPRMRLWSWSALRWHVVSFAACVVLAVIFTLPTSLAPASGLMGYSGDNFQHAWFLWQFAHAVVKLRNPFYTDLIYYPSRVNLSWSTTDPLAGMLALPISLTLGPVVAYNVSLMLQLALAAFCARLLCLRVCGNEVAALIGGACFGFSPFSAGARAGAFEPGDGVSDSGVFHRARSAARDRSAGMEGRRAGGRGTAVDGAGALQLHGDLHTGDGGGDGSRRGVARAGGAAADLEGACVGRGDICGGVFAGARDAC